MRRLADFVVRWPWAVIGVWAALLVALPLACPSLSDMAQKHPLAILPSDAPSLLPQVSHLDAFPTTLFLGRDGRVRATHTGFPSAASGEFYVRAREEMTATVERLLLEGATE